MSLLLRLILAAFSCYRLAQLITIDDGPYDVFGRLRLWTGKHAGKNRTWKTIADLNSCPFCLGIWLSIPLTVMVFLPNIVFDVILVFLAIAGAQTLMQEHSKENDR